jgi:hypothetical protein
VLSSLLEASSLAEVLPFFFFLAGESDSAGSEGTVVQMRLDTRADSAMYSATARLVAVL